MKTKVYTYTLYRTNRPNILGGYMTYFHLDDALKTNAEEVYAVTRIKKGNTIGIDTDGYLSATLWETRIK